MMVKPAGGVLKKHAASTADELRKVQAVFLNNKKSRVSGGFHLWERLSDRSMLF